MNLLVTNPQTPQAYAIIRALRPHARRIVATIEGEGLRARLSHGAYSRLVDARHRVPSPVTDWWAGRIGPENTDREQAFVDAVARICAQERIDTIYPSWDPFVYVLSKNRARFAELGVTIPVPDFETVEIALDKYRSIEAARRVGFPCPVTHLYESAEQAQAVGDALGYPVVLKPRCTSGGRGMAIVRNRRELAARLPDIVRQHGPPMIQEYVPGGQRDSVQYVIARNGDLVFAFHKTRTRTLRRTARFGTVSESASPDSRVAKTRGLAREIGWWGAMGIETIHDPRDGLDKLMEINPRFPRQLWNRTELGINEPMMCLAIARGENVAPADGYPIGVLFVSPVEDVQLFGLQLLDLLVYTVRTRLFRRPPLDPSTAPDSLAAQLRRFGQTYTPGRRRIWDPYSRYLLQDPAVAMLWWLQFSSWLAGAWRQLGR
jgi:biotin carboxylase